MKSNYRILTAENKIKHAGTDNNSWLTLEQARIDVDYSNGEQIYEYNDDRERLWEVF